ncbi:MAG: hypothetical protein GY863_14210 [bacterium]|nr:hypothetical protein [bacterium]
MRKTITFFIAFLLIASTGISQEKTTKKSKEFNKTKLEEMREIAMQKARQMNQAQIQEPDYAQLSRRPYSRTASLSMYYTRETFGIAPVYKHRINRDVLFVAELGVFNADKRSYEEYAGLSRVGGNNQFKRNAMLIPIYGGFRKGFFKNGKLRNYYPYIGGGAGPVIGVGEQTTDYNRYWNYWSSRYQVRLTGSAYLMAGVEFYSTKTWFVDAYVRYRHLRFGQEVGSWKNFSGFSIGLTFNRGFGGGYQLLR